MKKKFNSKLFFRILYILFIVFVITTVVSKSGYYENKINESSVFTKKEMKRFEKMIEEGNEIELDSFFKTNKKDYSNNLSKSSYELSIYMEKIFNNITKVLSNIVDKLF